MKNRQLAAQLYTVRAHTQTPAGIASALNRIRTMGYTAVEISGLGPVDDGELAGMLDGEGLVCCSSHEPGDQLLANPRRIAERMHRLKCEIATYPWPGDFRFDDLDRVRTFARQLNETGKILEEEGIRFCYHNHHMEFNRLGNRTALEVIYAETDPRYVKAELDTYWVQFGGGNPAAWCRKMNQRLLILHMKDYVVSPDNKVVFAEVGSGNLDWNEIVSAAEESACRWFVPEQDECAGDPFDSLKKSYDHIRAHYCAD